MRYYRETWDETDLFAEYTPGDAWIGRLLRLRRPVGTLPDQKALAGHYKPGAVFRMMDRWGESMLPRYLWPEYIALHSRLFPASAAFQPSEPHKHLN